jgi:tRNA (cytidine/uridine-2'-O-)-methyltransferase
VFHVILYQPEIPANTGNIIRLCANTGVAIHLIHPLGFTLEDSRLKRAGLDYHEYATVREYPSFHHCLEGVQPGRVFACSTRGQHRYSATDFQPGDAVVFGPETRGLPASILAACGADRVLRLPMLPGSRSVNLANAVAVVVYEAWRQNGFAGAADK